MSGRPRVVCAGGSVVDRKLLIAHPPIPGTSNPARGITSFGGVARNVTENLARLGVPVALVSRVGDDDAGRAVTNHLADLGVDVRHVHVALSGETAQYVAMLDPKGQLVLGAAAMDVLDGLAPSDLDVAWPSRAETATWVFADCNLPIDTLAHAVRRARTEGTRLAVDGVSNPKVGRLPRDLTGIEVLFCNRDEARSLADHHGWISPDGDIDLACLLHEEGAAQVVLTRGADGVVLVDRNGPRILPATAASVFDVTGAGDALVSGTLAMLCAGADLDEAVTTGTLVAALTVESQHSVRPDLSADLVDAASVHRLRRPGQLAAAHLSHRQLELPSSPDPDPLFGPVPPLIAEEDGTGLVGEDFSQEEPYEQVEEPVEEFAGAAAEGATSGDGLNDGPDEAAAEPVTPSGRPLSFDLPTVVEMTRTGATRPAPTPWIGGAALAPVAGDEDSASAEEPAAAAAAQVVDEPETAEAELEVVAPDAVEGPEPVEEPEAAAEPEAVEAEPEAVEAAPETAEEPVVEAAVEPDVTAPEPTGQDVPVPDLPARNGRRGRSTRSAASRSEEPSSAQVDVVPASVQEAG